MTAPVTDIRLAEVAEAFPELADRIARVRSVPMWLRPDLPALADLVADPAPSIDWHLDGRCRTDDKPDRWFPGGGITAQYARRECGKCPVRLRCLAEAALANERYGVWGGAIPAEIAHVRVALDLVERQGEATDTECAQGHPWTEDSLAYDAGGRRSCRVCNRIAKRDERRRARARASGYVAAVDGRRRYRGTA